MKLLTLFFALLASAQAATWYVRTDGNDSNSGNANTAGGAKLTLDSALSIGALAAGDTIQVGAGTFTGASNTDVAGSSGLPITIIGAGMGVTTFTGTLTIDQNWYTVTDATWQDVYVYVSGADDVTLTRVEAWGAGYCVRMSDTSDRLTLDSVVLHHINSREGMIDAKGTAGLVINSTIRDSNGNDAIRANGATGWTFRSNTFLRINSPSSFVANSTTSNTVGTGTKTFTVDADPGYVVQDRLRFTSGVNYIEGRVTGISGLDVTISVLTTSGSGTFASWTVGTNDPGNHADSVQAWSYNSYDNIFERNLWKDCGGQLGNMEANPDAGLGEVRDYTFRNNIFWNSRIQINLYAPGFKFYNNTIYSTSGTTGFRGATATKGNGNPVTVFNNIFCRVGTGETAGPYSGTDASHADYNFISEYANDTSKTGYSEAHGINGGYTPTQLFTDADNGDFSIAVGSPVIGQGTNLSSTGFSNDYNGTTRTGAWDMGAIAYEADTTPPVLDPPGTSVNGGLITLSFNKPVQFGAGGNGGFALTASGGSSTMTYSSGSTTIALVYSLSRSIGAGETLTLAYTQPGNGVEDASGNDLVTFSGTSVTNNTAASDTTPPEPNPMTIASYNTLTANAVNIVASTATDVGTPPVEYDIEISGVWQGWQSSATFAVTGLTSNTLYYFRVRARDSVVTPNVTTASEYSLITTLSAAPTPDPPTYSQTSNITSIAMTMDALTTGNPPAEIYYRLYAPVYAGGELLASSGWTIDTDWEFTGLTGNTYYETTAQTRDSLGNTGFESNKLGITTQLGGSSISGKVTLSGGARIN